MTILDQLAGHARERVAASKSSVPLEELRLQALLSSKEILGFESPEKKTDSLSSVSASGPRPQRDSSPRSIPTCKLHWTMRRQVQTASQCSLSPKWFLGSGRHLQEIARTASIPCLRKDFTVDEYMIYEAKVLGASAVLLICAILTERQIREYLHTCDELGLSALVEVHNEAEAETALRAGRGSSG